MSGARYLTPPVLDPSRPTMLLDRDGVLNIDHGYVGTWDRFEFTPGAPEAVAQLNAAGWRVIVVTNQSGIGRGLFTDADFHALHDQIDAALARHGAHLDAVYYCPHHPEAVLPEFRALCDCRKPKPGLLLRAMAEWGVPAHQARLIGDSPRDIEAAAAAGIPGHLFSGDLGADVARLLER